MLIDGQVAPQNRQNLVDDFNAPGFHQATEGKLKGDNSLVAFITDCNSTGINMARGNVLILLVSTVLQGHPEPHFSVANGRDQDSQWSEQDRKQTIGRVWRQGQKQEVTVYTISARDTCDMSISHVARRKGYWAAQFSDDAEGYEAILEGYSREVQDLEVDPNGTQGQASGNRGKSTVVAKRKKNPPQDSELTHDVLSGYLALRKNAVAKLLSERPIHLSSFAAVLAHRVARIGY